MRKLTFSARFRGFYTLFWIFTGLLVLNSFITSFQKTGEVLSMTFASLMSRDAGILALSDAVLVLSTFLCVPLVRAMHRYHWRYGHRVVYVQYVWHVVLLAAVIRWMRVRYVTHSRPQRLALGPVGILRAACHGDDHESTQLSVHQRHHVRRV